MASRKRPAAKPEPRKYELKHRLTGATILVCTAVITIPLLLKDPNIQASIDKAEETPAQSQEFKSKIEPLDLSSLGLVKSEDSLRNSNDGTKTDKKKSALIQPVDLGASKDSGTPEAEEDATAAANQDSQETEGKSDSDNGDEVVETSTSSESETTAQESQPKQDASADTGQQVAAADTDSGVTDGWTVRVGTFTKKENVTSVTQLLEKSGFNARHTKVTTTLGDATRVWLGPYEDKAAAEKVSARLKTLTGEKGYITKHAS